MAQLAIDFNSYMKISSNFFKGSGMQFETIESQPNVVQKLKIIGKNCFFIFGIVNILTFYGFTCKLMFEKSKENVKLLFYLFSTGESTGVAIIRIIYMFIIKSDVGKISQLLTRSFTKQEAEYYQLGGDIKSFTTIMRFYMGGVGLTITFFILEPIVTLILSGQRTFGSITPFDEEATRIEYYPFALLWTFGQFCILISILIGVDLIFYSAIMVTILEFKKLRTDFEDLKKSKQLSIDIKQLIVRHDDLYSNVKMLENAFSFSLFCNFYSTELLICFTALQASTSSDVAELIGMAYYCISSLLQIFVQCYFGDLLRTASEEVIYGVYDSGWEEMTDMSVRRELPLIIKRTQMPAKLTLMKFSNVSLSQFVGVVSFSYSFYTVCRQMYYSN